MKKTHQPPRLAVVPPPPPLLDRTYAEIGDDFARLSVELAMALQVDRLEAEDRRAVRTAFLLSNKAAIMLQNVTEEQHKRRVSALDDRCLCGWDRGSHMVAPPHLCEDDERCTGFRLAIAQVPDVADTLPPPAPSSPTLVCDRELEDVS